MKPFPEQGRRFVKVSMLLTMLWPLRVKADRRPTREELAVERAQQEALDAIDAERAQRAKELAEKEEVERLKLSPENEAAVMREIAEAYREATIYYEQRASAAAQARFLDCFSLCQLAGPRSSDPTRLKKIQEGCQERLESLRKLDLQSAQAGGLKKKMAEMALPQFNVSDAELGAVLELIRRKTAEIGKCQPPNFTMVVPPEVLQRKITLELKGVPMLTVLELVLRIAGTEARFDKYSVVVTELPRAKKPDSR